MPSIASNMYLHKCFASGRLLYEATIPSLSRFWMRQCVPLTFQTIILKMHAWDKLIFLSAWNCFRVEVSNEN